MLLRISDQKLNKLATTLLLGTTLLGSGGAAATAQQGLLFFWTVFEDFYTQKYATPLVFVEMLPFGRCLYPQHTVDTQLVSCSLTLISLHLQFFVFLSFFLTFP
jgi:hypothetical protein